MRRALLIAAFLLLAAPAATLAQGRATVKLSSKPDKVPAGEPWKVVLTIKQPGRAPRADLSPSIEVRDADGFSTTYPAAAAKKAGPLQAPRSIFPKAGQWTYAIRDGISATPPRCPLGRDQGRRAGRRPPRSGRAARAADRVRRRADPRRRGLRAACGATASGLRARRTRPDDVLQR